jgi:uncharacterized protein YndB with AHSA1/START domain
VDVPNEVRRAVEIAASRERVWAALTRPEELVGWFPTERAEIDLRPGGACRFVWDDSTDEGIVDAVDPPERLVFRWRPAGLGPPYTTVTFELEEMPRGTRLTLVGSGFASLPDQIRQQSRDGNDAGWAEELEELRTYLEAA